MNLAQWLEIEPNTYDRAPYDRPCPNCGASMIYPTSCHCTFELRVWALADIADWSEWTRRNVIAVNRAMRALDDSSSWPTCGRFNLTDRAIRRVLRAYRYDALALDDYVRNVNDEIGRIVNSDD